MTHEQDDLAIVFSDIVGSSLLYSSLGNERAKRKIDAAVAAMCRVAENSGGRVIKTLGDEIMFAHQDAEQACATIVKMNQALNAMHFYLRTGACFGKVILDDKDVYGDTVNNAAFLANTAQANQVLLEASTYEHLTTFRNQCEYFDRLKLKGQQSQSVVYRLNWEQNHTAAMDATVVLDQAISVENGMPTQLQVLHQGKIFRVDPNTELVIGRDHSMVQLCVRHKNASRKHCSFSYHRGKFVLKDHSTNGTYLKQEGHQELFLRRESTPIMADGEISIGQPCDASDLVLKYHLD